MPLAISSLSEVQAIFDKTYLVLSGGSKITKSDREVFCLKTFDNKHGSLETDLEIIYDVAQLAIPVLATFSSKDIWELTKQSWELLKFVYKLAEKGEKPVYQANDDSTLTVHNGDIHNTYKGPVYQIAEASVEHWRALNHKLKKGAVTNYSMGSADNPEIQLRDNEKSIFDNPTHIEKEPVPIFCDIFDFNKRSNVGKLTVIGVGEIIEGDYSFSVVGDQDRIEYISSMTKSQVKALVLKEVSLDPFGEVRVKRLHIVEISH